MKHIFIALSLLIGTAVAQEPAPRLFIVHFITGPAWQADKSFNDQKDAQGHSQNLARMRKEGILIMGARYADKGMIVVLAATENDVRAQLEQDPTIVGKVFAFEIAPFAPFYDGCVVRSQSKKEACQ